MDYLELTEEIRQFAEKSVKKSRYEHSVRVAQMCARICRAYKFDEEKGYLIGIAHDICKNFSDKEMIETASRDGKPIDAMEIKKTSLLHGRAAAVLMKEKFGITDPELLEAVAIHTFGKVGMCDLSKVLFIADKVEPGRPQATQEYLSHLFSLSFEEMFEAVLDDNYSYIKNKGYELYPESTKVVKYYLGRE